MEAELPFHKYWDCSSDEESDDDGGDDEYSSMRYDDIVSADDFENKDLSWVYKCRSKAGSRYCGDLSKRVATAGQFKLLHNPTDEMLLEKWRVESKNALNNIRSTLQIDKDTQIDAAAALAAVTPRHYIELLQRYLLTTIEPGESTTWTFKDLGSFLRCEVLMRLYSTSESELSCFGVSEEVIAEYKKVRLALTKADKPASKRKVFDGG